VGAGSGTVFDCRYGLRSISQRLQWWPARVGQTAQDDSAERFCATCPLRLAPRRRNVQALAVRPADCVAPLCDDRRMCLLCDGYSEEDVMQHIDLAIRVHGWQLTQVEAEDRPWTYTIGLLETYGHPELLVADVRLGDAADLLRALVPLIAHHGSLPLDELDQLGLALVPVHETHLTTSLVAAWSSHYGHSPEPGSFMQVVPPPDWFCACHQHASRRFDRVDAQPAAPNRAARRAAARQKRYR